MLVMLVALAVLGSRWAEALPILAQALGLVAVLPMAARVAHRALAAPPGVLELLPGRRARWTRAAGVAEEASAVLHEQWPVVTVRLLPRGATVVFWPDTLCDSGRRALRRWAGAAPEATPLSQFWTG